VGILIGAAGVGSIISAALAPWMRRRFGFGACWLGGMALNGITLALIGMLTGVWAIAILAMGFTFGDTLSGINSMSLRQEITPDHLLGRVTSAFWTLNQAFGPIGAAIATAIAARAGAGAVLMWMGILVLALPLAGLLTPAHERHPERRATLYASTPTGATGAVASTTEA
jgi:MFS family permease